MSAGSWHEVRAHLLDMMHGCTAAMAPPISRATTGDDESCNVAERHRAP